MPWAAAEPIAAALVTSLERVLSGTPAEKELDSFLRAHRDLSAEGRAAAAETLFGVGLWRRRLAWHVPMPQPSARWLWFALMRSLGKEVWAECARIAGVGAEPVALRTGTPTALGVKWSAPDWLAETIQREVGADADKFFRAVSVPGPIFLRVNTLKISRDVLIDRLVTEEVDTKPSTWARSGLFVMTQRPNLFGLPAKQEALFEVQDEGSQLLAQLVGAEAGDQVVDFCAGAGGKTLALACEVGATGLVHAHDVDNARLERLRVRAEKAGATNVRVHFEPPKTPVRRVLVDAPCSELGALRRGPDSRWRIQPELFSELPRLQREILTRASALVAPGGTLVYATCTLRREENEDVARVFEADHPEFARSLPEWAAKDFAHDGFFRALPHKHGTDGFFAAVWRRSEPPKAASH